MIGAGEEVLRPRLFHDAAKIHYRKPVGEVLHHAEIMADEQQREAELALQVLQQVDDLRLDRDVERRDRLVADRSRSTPLEEPSKSLAAILGSACK